MPKLSEISGGGTLRLSDLGEGDVQIIGEQPADEQTPEELDSAWDFSGERTLPGRFLEGNKAVPRQFLTTALSGIGGIAVQQAQRKKIQEKLLSNLDEYPTAKRLAKYSLKTATNPNSIVKNIADFAYETGTGKEVADVPVAEKVLEGAVYSINYLNNDSVLKGDEKYADLWTTKLGGGAGSLGAFVLAGIGGPATLLPFAGGSGAFEQYQRIEKAKEDGIDISLEDESLALGLGSLIGMSEAFTPLRLLKAIPKNIPVPEKKKILKAFTDYFKTNSGEILKTGAGEGTQEVVASLAQSYVEMGYNPNAELPSGESLFDDFTIGTVLGSGAKAGSNIIQQRRFNAMSDVEIERERKAIEWENAQNALIREKIVLMRQQRELEKSDPVAFAQASKQAREQAFKVAPPSEEEVKQFNAPSAFGPVATPSAFGELYALRTIGSLGQSFPTNTNFSVTEIEGPETAITNPDGTQGVQKKPLFTVTDIDGNQYGQPLADAQAASSMASTLNKEIQSKGVRSSILDTLMVAPQGYTPEQADKLFRYGFRVLSPDSNRVTFAALNEAAGTTTENGYIEDLPLESVASAKEVRNGRFEVQMPDGTQRYITGLTASQELNLKRLQEGLPAATTFDISEARDALGGDVGRLALPGVSGIQDSLNYGAKVIDGKPVVISEANEVITQRRTTASEKARAGVDEDGKSVLPDYIEFKTFDEAKRYAGHLNQRAGTSRVLPIEILDGKEDIASEIKGLLDVKNIDAEIGSPELNQLVKAFTGAETFSDMTVNDQKLFYNRLRNLPKFNERTKVPVFKQKLFTPEQFVEVARFANQNGFTPSKAYVGAVMGLDKSDPNYDAATESLLDEIKRQNNTVDAEQRRFEEEVLPLREELKKVLESFGLSSDMLNLGTRLYDRDTGEDITATNEGGSEGYFDPAFEKIVMAVDAIDIEGNKTQEQRLDELKGVMSHEVVHALRAMGMFTQKEYAILETAVLRTIKPNTNGLTYLQWARRPRSQGGYFEDRPTVQVEEAIADMFRDFITNKKIIGGKPRSLMERIIKFFQKLRNMVEGYGFQTFSDVFAAVKSGEIGRRQRAEVVTKEDGTQELVGPVRSLRKTEEMREKYQRMLPGRYQKFGDIFGQGPTVTSVDVPEETVPTENGRMADFDPAALEGAEVRQSRKPIANVDERNKAFENLAKSQRGAPEIAMVRAQDALYNLKDPSKAGQEYQQYESSGMYSNLLEHVGDITHRMSEMPDMQPNLGLELVTPKVMRSIERLRNPIDLKNMSKIPSIPETVKYSEEHSKLEVFNEMQMLARDSAVAIGNKDFDTARINLQKIADAIADGSYASMAMEYNPDIRYSRKALPNTIEVDGVQRTTKNNEGKDIFPTEDGVRNFWRWFGDSDVVDEQGRPIVYYHGTKRPEEIDEFKSDTGMYWASPSPDFASKLGIGILPNENIPSVIPVYVRSLNAFKYNNPKHVRALSEQISKRGYKSIIPGLSEEANAMISFEKAKEDKKNIINDYATHEGLGRERGTSEDDNWDLYENLVDDIRALGFDGFHVFESGVDNIASFDNKSLKSAMSNIGTYDANDSRIRYSRKDLQGEPKIPFEVAPSPDNKERTAAWRMVPHTDKVRITQSLGPKAVREASKILGIDSAAFEPIISGQGLFEGHVNPNQILGIREQFMSPDQVLEFASVLGRILEQKAMIAADGRMTGRETSVIRIKTNVSSPKVADRIYAALTTELGDLGGYTAYKNHIDVFNFTDTDSETLAGRFMELLKTNTPDINARVSHDTIQSAYLESETYGNYLRRKKSANQERLERGIESARSRIIGELETSISRAGQRSDEQSRVRGLAPGKGRDTDTDGRTGPAKSPEEVKGPDWLPIPKLENTESIPAFSQSKPKKDSVSAFVAHYSNAQGLMSLDGSFAGTGSAGREARRFGLGNYGKKAPPGSLARRLYFYVQSKNALPKKERVVAGNSIYRARLDNLYDAYNDPRGFSDEAGMNADYFEELVSDAGFDGAIYSEMPGIDEPTVVLFGLKKKVPVRAYNEPLPERPLAIITEEQAAEAVAKAEEDTKRTGTGAVPLYGKNASPEALYIAQNPEQAATLTKEDEVRYSRRNTPNYSPRARQIIDKNTPRPPDETVGISLINMLGFPSARDMFDSFRANFIQRYARVERITRENEALASQTADVASFAAIAMADRSSFIMAQAAAEGVPVYENGMSFVKDFFHKGKKIRGLIGLDEMLFSKEYGNMEELAQAYATAVRGERLNSEGKLTPVSPGELVELKKEVEKFINPKTGNPIILEWFDAWQDYNSYVVKFLRDTGVIDEAGAALWLKQADYIPFYREDASGNLVHPRVFGGLHTAGQFKAVGKSDKAINVDMRTAIFNNIDVAIAMGMKNVAQQRLIRDLEKLGLATMLKSGEQVGNRQSVNFKVKGKRYTAIIEDPLLYEAMLPVSELNLGDLTEKILSVPAQGWREIITRNPDFGITNAIKDSLSAFIIVRANIVPVLSAVQYFFAPLSKMFSTQKLSLSERFLRDISEIEKMGIISGKGGYDLGKDALSVKKFYARELKKRQSNISWWKNPLIAAWDALGRFTERTEAATRIAVYNDVLKRSGSPAEAQYQAISVMNYAIRGNNKILRLVTMTVPFTNANIQGKDKLYQAMMGRTGSSYKKDSKGNIIRDTSRKKAIADVAGRSLLMVLGTVLYYAMIHDEEEYLTASPEMRDNYYILPIIKGDIEKGEPGLSLNIPTGFDTGSLFKAIPERILALTMGQDSYQDFEQSMMRQLKNQLLGGMPINIKPYYEAYITNYDSFSGRPVVPTFMQNLEPEQQKTFYTNRFISKAAESAGMSPMKLEHMISGYFPGLGSWLLMTLDSITRTIEGPEAQKPAMQWFQSPGIKRLFTNANKPGLVNQFYDLKDSVDGVVQTINRLEKEGRDDELAVFYAKNGHMYEMRREINSIERQIKRLRDERKIIEEMAIDPESKRVLIEEINMQINASLLTIPMLRNEAFGNPREE
jgi:hypothetical protein